MKPRYPLLIAALALCLALTACGNGASKEPPDLRGQWRQAMSGDRDEEPEYYHLARITDDYIEIYYYFTADGSTNLFWYGSFTPPEDGKEPYEWVSENKLSANIDSRLFRYASRDAQKSFTYKKGKLSYDISPSQALRMTVTLERAETEVEIRNEVPTG